MAELIETSQPLVDGMKEAYETGATANIEEGYGASIEEDFDLPPEIGEFCKMDIEIPQSIKNIIDKIIGGGDTNVWDQIKINISPAARRVIDTMIGDTGNYIDKDELGKFKDALDWGLYTTD